MVDRAVVANGESGEHSVHPNLNIATDCGRSVCLFERCPHAPADAAYASGQVIYPSPTSQDMVCT
jgi:hypothetical protein